MSYISGVFQKTASIAEFNMTGPGQSDQAFVDAAHRKNDFENVRPDEMPPELWWTYSDTDAPATLPAMFRGTFLYVSSALADILREHDLGAGFLWPVVLREYDGRKVPVQGVSGLHVGAIKTSLLEGDARSLRKLTEDPPRWMLPRHPLAPDTVRLGANAEEGADIWREREAPTILFLSDKLVSAIEAAGLADDLYLTRCAVGGND